MVTHGDVTWASPFSLTAAKPAPALTGPHQIGEETGNAKSTLARSAVLAGPVRGRPGWGRCGHGRWDADRRRLVGAGGGPGGRAEVRAMHAGERHDLVQGPGAGPTGGPDRGPAGPGQEQGRRGHGGVQEVPAQRWRP